MRPSRASMLLAAVGGLVGFLVGAAGSLILGLAAGLITFLICLWVVRARHPRGPRPVR